MTKHLKDLWTKLSPMGKLGLVLVITIALGVAFAFGGGVISEWRSRRADRAVAAKQQEIEAIKIQNATLKTQRDEAVGRAKEKEDAALVKDGQIDALNLLIDKSNAPIQAAQEKINDASKQLEVDLAATDVSISDAERERRICAKFKALGIPALASAKCP